MEPSMFYYIWNNFLSIAVPFFAYFLGIVIRKKVMPGRGSLPLRRQMLLGIPASLVVVSPILPVVNATIPNLPGFLVTMGLIMEQGMLLNETVTNRLKKEIGKLKEGAEMKQPIIPPRSAE
jgi:fucose 4-O-acetylase-like acetyltransferase